MSYLSKTTEQKLKYLFKLILGILILSTIIYSVYFALLKIFGFLVKVRSDVLAAIVAGFFMFIVHIVVAFLNQRHLKQRDIDESHRTKKVEIYKKYLDITSKMQAGMNPRLSHKELSEDDLTNFFVEFRTELVLWGSPKVIKSFQYLHKPGLSSNPKELHIAMNQFYQAIREDIGLGNKGLNDYELNKIYLSDPNELDEIMKN